MFDKLRLPIAVAATVVIVGWSMAEGDYSGAVASLIVAGVVMWAGRHRLRA